MFFWWNVIRSCRLSSLFILFLCSALNGLCQNLFFSWLILSSICSTQLQIFSIAAFISWIKFFSSRICLGLFFYDFYPISKYAILFVYFSWIHRIVFLSFLIVFWVTSKQLFWITLQLDLKIPCLGTCILENYYLLTRTLVFDFTCSL